MLSEELRPQRDPVRALEEAQEIARHTTALIREGFVPDFVEVDRLCELVLDFISVIVKERR